MDGVAWLSDYMKWKHLGMEKRRKHEMLANITEDTCMLLFKKRVSFSYIPECSVVCCDK
jgi:hypothetical protein